MHHNTKPHPSARQLRRSAEEPRPVDRILADIANRVDPYAPTPPEDDADLTPPINVDISRPPKQRERAAYTDETGRIVTKVWAQRTTWDGIIWRVSQYRTQSHALGSGHYRSFHFEDLNDAMRGLYRAQRWIRRMERRRRRSWWPW